MAALTHLIDTGEAPGWWLRVDPVHLHADLHQLRLTDWTADDLAPDEVTALLESLNHHCQDLGWYFEAPHPQRWYLRPRVALDLHTQPPVLARQQDIRRFLPTGSTAREWSSRLTEIQMLLFEHPVNQAREARGAMTVNSLWAWGGGSLPHDIVIPAATLYGDDPLLRGLAAHAGVTCHKPPTNVGDCLNRGKQDSLVVLDIDVMDLEQDWLIPLLRALQRGRLWELHLLPGDAQYYHLNPWHAWQLWYT